MIRASQNPFSCNPLQNPKDQLKEQLLIFKNPLNDDPEKKHTLERNDVVLRFVSNKFILGTYIEGDVNNDESYQSNFYIEF